jgi:hypothetical protein
MAAAQPPRRRWSDHITSLPTAAKETCRIEVGFIRNAEEKSDGPFPQAGKYKNCRRMSRICSTNENVYKSTTWEVLSLVRRLFDFVLRRDCLLRYKNHCQRESPAQLEPED